EVIYQKETVEGAARKLGFFQTVAGDLGFEQRFHEAVARVTPEQLQEVARRTFARSRLSAALLLPAPAEGTTRAVGGDGAPPGAPPREAAPGTPEPSGQPVAGRLQPAEERPLQGEETLGTTLAVGGLPARDPAVPALAASYAFPDEGRLVQLAREVERATVRRFQAPPLPPAVQGIHRLTLDSGLTLLIQPDRSVPLVAARVAFLGGLRAETVQTQGIENLVARLLTQGTSTRAGEEIAREFDRLGGGVGGFSGRNTLGLRAEFHADHLAEGLALLADCLLDPVFPAVEVERERDLVLEEIRARDDNLGSLAFRAFAGQLFRDHPYRFDLLGEEETVARLTRQQLQEHYTRRYGLARGVLSVVGDVDPAEVVRLVHGLLGRPGASGMAPPPRLPWTPPDSRQLVFRYRDRAQAHIVLGFPGATVDSPDRFALDLLHTVLNGQGGRLFRELRDRRGLAYSVGAALTEGVDPGSFALYLAVAPERVDEAVTALLAELRRLQAEGIDPAELRRAQEYLLGSQAISLQRGSERAATLAFNELYQLGCDAHLRYPAAILAVSAEGVRDVARRYLDLERYTLAVVKPQDARDAGIDAVPPGP
ncbi:MAG: insulinase family protein, partial [Myxococcota bacterium]|nr:insulinase family protein [Myxococcota bacterium]